MINGLVYLLIYAAFSHDYCLHICGIFPGYFSLLINGLVYPLICVAFSHDQLKWIGSRLDLGFFPDIPFPQFLSHVQNHNFSDFPPFLLETFTWSLITLW